MGCSSSCTCCLLFCNLRPIKLVPEAHFKRLQGSIFSTGPGFVLNALFRGAGQCWLVLSICIIRCLLSEGCYCWLILQSAGCAKACYKEGNEIIYFASGFQLCCSVSRGLLWSLSTLSVLQAASWVRVSGQTKTINSTSVPWALVAYSKKWLLSWRWHGCLCATIPSITGAASVLIQVHFKHQPQVYFRREKHVAESPFHMGVISESFEHCTLTFEGVVGSCPSRKLQRFSLPSAVL